MDTETLNFPPGVYRIAVANSVEPQFMTNQKDYVTILPPGVGPEIEQEVIHPINDEFHCCSLSTLLVACTHC